MTQGLALHCKISCSSPKYFDQTNERNAREHRDRIRVYPSVPMRCDQRQRTADTTQRKALRRIVNPALVLQLLHLFIIIYIYIDGYFVSEGNIIGVQYYGEWRSFRVVRIQSLGGETGVSTTSPVKLVSRDSDQDVVRQLSELVLDSPSTATERNADSARSSPSSSGVPMFKVTAKSRMVVSDPAVEKKQKVSDAYTVEPLCKDTPEMRTSTLNRTL